MSCEGTYNIEMQKDLASDLSKQQSHDPAFPLARNELERSTLEDDPHSAAIEDDYRRTLSLRTWAAVFFLGFTFQPALAFSILTIFPVISVIAVDIQGTTVNSAWMSSGWTLGGTVAFAIAGRMSDIFGRRYVLLFGQLTLIISYIIGATAHHLDQLIASMVIGGFGTGTALVLYPGLSEILPNRYRSVGLAWTEFNLVPMAVFGSLAGHALAKNASWRWIFIIGAITGAISLAGSAFFYHPPRKPHAVAHSSRLRLLKELDYLGFFLYTAGLTVLLIGLYQGGNTKEWHQAGVVTPITLGGIVLIGCFIWELSGIPKRPLFPHYLFSKFREFTVLIVCIFVTGFCYYAMTSLIPQQLLYVYSTDPIRLGELQMAEGAGNVFGGVVMGALVHKFKHVHIQLMVAVFMQTLFLGLSALDTPSTTAQTLAFHFLATVPFAWVTVACYVTASLHIPLRDLGIAHGSIGTFRFLGGALGSTTLNIIINEKSTEKVAAYIANAVLPLGFPKNKIAAFSKALAAGKPLTVKGVTPEIAAAGLKASREAWTYAFRIAFLATIPFGVIAMLSAWFVADPSKYFTQHVAVRLEHDKNGNGKQEDSEHT